MQFYFIADKDVDKSRKMLQSCFVTCNNISQVGLSTTSSWTVHAL